MCLCEVALSQLCVGKPSDSSALVIAAVDPVFRDYAYIFSFKCARPQRFQIAFPRSKL